MLIRNPNEFEKRINDHDKTQVATEEYFGLHNVLKQTRMLLNSKKIK